jgi:hypothetical protein
MKSFGILLINIYEKKKKKNETIVQYSTADQGVQRKLSVQMKNRGEMMLLVWLHSVGR